MTLDVSMPRDLRDRRRAKGYCAISIVGVESEQFYRVLSTEDVENTLRGMQRGNWRPLQIKRLLWTPGIEIARTVVSQTESGLRERGWPVSLHWCSAPIAEIEALIKARLNALRSKYWTHDQLVAALRETSNREADQFARGIF